MPDSEAEMFVRKQASELIADIGKDKALDFLFGLLIKSIKKEGEFAPLSPKELESNQLITIGVIWEVMKYTQIA